MFPSRVGLHHRESVGGGGLGVRPGHPAWTLVFWSCEATRDVVGVGSEEVLPAVTVCVVCVCPGEDGAGPSQSGHQRTQGHGHLERPMAVVGWDAGHLPEQDQAVSTGVALPLRSAHDRV